MFKDIRLRPIVVSVLLLACAREAVCDDLVTTYEALFNDHVEIALSGYQGGSNKLTGFPLLVRLSEDAPSGFQYARVDKAGADIRFIYHYVTNDVSHTEAVPYEVDTWNTNGVSALWVRLPVVNNNAANRLTMYWAPNDPSALPANAPASVWAGYAGVWHMNGAAESTAQATVGAIGATASARTGVVGAALGTGNSGAHGPILQIPSGSSLASMTGGAYTVTAWLKAHSIAGSPWLYSARTNQTDDAFGAELLSDATGLSLKLHADGATADGAGSKRFGLDEWVHLAVVHDDADGVHHVYLNGTDFYNPSAGRTDRGGANGFAFGGLVGASAAGTLNGDLDDVRVFSGALSRPWCTNEYAQAVSSSYLAFGTVFTTGLPVYVDEEEVDPGSDPAPGTGEASPSDYAGTAVFVPDGAEAGVTLTNFVSLVKVWEGEPSGFFPKTLPFGPEEIRFFDQDGNVLDHEIDTWDDNDVSYFWVKIPRLTRASRITMCWGLREGRTLPEVDPTAVWSGYAGVWHMTDGSDATANGSEGTFGTNAFRTGYGQIGGAAGTLLSGQKGAILDIAASETVDALTNGPFTASGWLKVNRTTLNYGALFSRGSAADPAWGAQFCGGTTGDSSALAVTAGGSILTSEVEIAVGDWVRFDFIYASERLAIYLDGELKGESAVARTVLNGSSGTLSLGGCVAAAEGVLGSNTLNGYLDEFRLRAGAPSAAELAAEYDQGAYDDFFTREPVVWDSSAVLQNRWRELPTASKTEWNEDEEAATFSDGTPWYGTSVRSYRERTTGEALAEMPTEPGDYLAVFTVAAVEPFSSLTYTIDFRIRMHRPTHDLGAENDRILLLNNDETVSDGKVLSQSYSDTASGLGRPYWVHDCDTGLDYTSVSPDFNFCGGLRHTYWSSDGASRLWDLLDVRYGNTYNNADDVYFVTGGSETGEEGLWDDQNYLSWNPDGGCLVDIGYEAGPYHEYAAQAVLCNTLQASINSCLYSNGIGTVYFDCVNSHTDDAADGYYKLVVEVATNALDRATGRPSGLPTDEAIAATHTEWSEDEQAWVEVTHDSYKFADWKRVEMHVRLVNGSEMTDLGTTDELTLDLAGGGSYTNFYRIYAPVDCTADARFRIRRTAINPDYTISPDVHSMILVDNVICSIPTDHILLEPRGIYEESKIRRETVGYEGAFNPSYPSVNDTAIYARARAFSLSGQPVTPGRVSSIRMNYRWRYLNQQATDWLSVDLEPTSLVSLKPISWPMISGDLEYWYEVNQSNEFYEYADYSGLGLGLPGYTEEVSTGSGRSPSYDPETDTGDWFTRIRDGKSTYGAIKLHIRRGASAAVETVDMFVARDRIWRGFVQATNAVSGGIAFRFEGRNCQNDALADFQYNTNRWYFADAAASLPVSGSVVEGGTNDWGRVPCDGATGHILFQLDESTRALTVVHADWQDFNGWNDAHGDYFTGTSTADGSKSGASSGQREYSCLASQWSDDIATNSYWSERFVPTSWVGYDFYSPFETETSPNGFDVGEGMWVYGAYALEPTVAGMALQMAGQGRGWIQLTSPGKSPRGLESVKFSARIAQTVSPDDFAYYEDGSTLNDYSFLTRAAFDLNANSNFTGNASLSLAAFYRPRTGCYEARWEQIGGTLEDGSGTIMGPTPRGQRLALYRWRRSGQEWIATELFAATNSGSVYSWNKSYSPKGIPQAHSVTNNGLMPFMIGAYDNAAQKYTVVVAAVHIAGVATLATNLKGNNADSSMNYLGTEKGWLYITYRDTAADRLTRGTYGALSANCEGVFVRPQYHPGIVSWLSKDATRTIATKLVQPGKSSKRGETANFYDYANAYECSEAMAEDLWIVPDGRMRSACASSVDHYANFSAAVVTQTVDVYTAPLGTANWSKEPVASQTLTGFGKPGVLQDAVINFWSADDSSVRIRAGGTVARSVRTDVVVDNIEISQWRGQDWLGETSTERILGGPTNFVYTSGWISNGALQLSPRRTPDDYPSSLRVPLCDGKGTVRRGLGLGSFSIRYRNAQTNACLLVQIATNGCTSSTLRDYTLDPGFGDLEWTTVTNWDFSVMTDEARASGVLACSLGLHGVAGTLRVIVDPTLRERVRDVDDPTAFGSVEIVSALFRDEPALDKGCWWGFNIRTIGDVSDVEQRMYLPDNPMRRVLPPLDEYGMSLALNNSIEDGCDPAEVAKSPNPYRAHMPFLQTPTFASNVVGEVSFKARKYSILKGSQCAEVSLYGTQSTDLDSLADKDWKLLNVFIVSNTTYETYRFKTDGSASYRAFRFAVTGVDGVEYPGPQPVCGDEPVRVLLDDVLVSEAVRARLAFRNTGAFRHDISKTTRVANVPSTAEQPICGEGWGVQTEIYPAMLGDEIDPSVKPRVKLHYYKGLAPWGYSQWKSLGTSAWLTQATDTNTFYRSSALDSPAAVIPMSSSPEIVQYMLEVVYTLVNPETGGRAVATNYLESADWSVPSWYYPVDFNASQGGGSPDRFAAFAVIEPIAPGWAWINEVNLFGAFDSYFRNSDRERQYVEVVKPVEFDLEGWSLRMLAAKSYGASKTAFLTNEVAVFGRNVSSQKAGTAKCNYMSFIVVGNPTTTLTGTEYDGGWHFSSIDNRVFESGGVLGCYYPVAMQLVRPSGIIEHEIAILGTNAYESVATSIAWQYTSTNLVRQLKAAAPNSSVFAVPDDNTATTTSAGVFAERGKSELCWNATMTTTPGDLNEGQYINPDYPRPGGELIMVFAYVDTSLGPVYQTVGGGTNTAEMQTVTLPRDSEAGLDIRYTVDPWYELGTVKETEGSAARTPVVVKTAQRQYTVNVAKGATGNVTVTASAAVDSALRRYGIDEHNRYTPAVLRWLTRHTDAYGNDFYGWRGATTNDTIHLAEFRALSGEYVRDMTLTEMYWLDIDPTASNMSFTAGMVRPPEQVVVKEPKYDPESDPKAYTNLRLGVYMAISNGNGRVTHLGNSAWAPYVLRGLGPDELSWDYYTTLNSASGAWTSETFKVTGFLDADLTSKQNRDSWIPLRYFVFHEDSFDANFETEIDVADPFSTSSPAYSEGWYQISVDYGRKPTVYLRWDIDERLRPITAEVLAPTNRLDGTSK